jgi:hypothetical protein
MRTCEPHGIRNAVLVVFSLLSGWILANMYMSESISLDKDRFVAGYGSYGIRQRLMETLVSLPLPTWFFDREAVSISRERNTIVLKSVFEVFDPSLRSILTSVPIVLDSSADTAKAYSTRGYIGVSPDWDNTVRQSRYKAIYEQRGMKPNDPVFMNRFKTDLLIHEFLHILQVRQGIDAPLCYDAIARWYIDPRYGAPSPRAMVYADAPKNRIPDKVTINRMKYILWHELYNYRRLSDVPQDESWKNMKYRKRYRFSKKGVEEFAYVGQEILSSGSGSENYVKTGQWCDSDWRSKKIRLLEVSPEIIAVFKGVFNPALTQ